MRFHHWLFCPALVTGFIMLLTKPSLSHSSVGSSPVRHIFAASSYSSCGSAHGATLNAAALPFSTHALDRRVDDVIRCYCTSDAFNWLGCASAKLRRASALHLPASEPASDDASAVLLSKEYAHTCVLLWQTLNESVSSVPSPDLVAQIQRLGWVWAKHQYHSVTDTDAQHLTMVAMLQAQWRSPHIQTALHSATTKLLNDVSTVSIQRYPTSWAYLCGCLMYQLLQWNHQLTPETLRELFC